MKLFRDKLREEVEPDMNEEMTRTMNAQLTGEMTLESTALFQAKMDSIKNELYSFAYRLMGNREDAEDLLQESYFKAYKYFHQLRDKGKFKEWIFQITANQFRNQLKKKKREKTYFVDDFNVVLDKPQNTNINPDNIYDGLDLSEKIRFAIDRLHPKMKTALVLFELQGFNIDEVSGILGISPGTVKSRLHYARKRLKDELLKTGHGRAWEKEYNGANNG
jgi:RNA polymerase sigma-70 factor, ECF subfamily